MPICGGTVPTCPTPGCWLGAATPGEAGEGLSQPVPPRRGWEVSCPPDGDLELLLRRHQEAAEGLVGLIEAHQQDLLHAGHLGGGRGGRVGRAAVGRAALAPPAPPPPSHPRPPVPWRRPRCGAAPWAPRPRGRAAWAPRRTAAGTGSLRSRGMGSAGPGAGGTPRGPGALTLLRAPDEDYRLQRHLDPAPLRRPPQPRPLRSHLPRPARRFRTRGCDTSARRALAPAPPPSPRRAALPGGDAPPTARGRRSGGRRGTRWRVPAGLGKGGRPWARKRGGGARRRGHRGLSCLRGRAGDGRHGAGAGDRVPAEARACQGESVTVRGHKPSRVWPRPPAQARATGAGVRVRTEGPVGAAGAGCQAGL